MLQQKQRIAPLREIIRNSFNFPKNKAKPRATCSHEALLLPNTSLSSPTWSSIPFIRSISDDKPLESMCSLE